MARRAIALLAGLALLAAGCGADDPDPPRLEAGGARWQAIERSMPAAADPASPNVCGRGAPDCIGEVTREMTRRLDRSAATCDHNAAFALMYLRVTEGAGGTEAVRFDDTRYLNHLDAVFADLYFRAFDDWRADRRSRVPEAWRLAFEAADKRQLAGIGDMLVGMNAHISRDLPYALAKAGLRTPGGKSGEPDYDLVNTLLGKVQGPMLFEAARRFDPTIRSTTLPLALGASTTVAEIITRWRNEAWENAKRLLAAPNPQAKARVAKSIEAAAAGRARLLIALSSNLVVGPGADERLGYCRSRRSR